MWIQERSSSRVFALGGVEKGSGGGGKEGGEERSFSSFCKESLFWVRWKDIASPPLSLVWVHKQNNKQEEKETRSNENNEKMI